MAKQSRFRAGNGKVAKTHRRPSRPATPAKAKLAKQVAKPKAKVKPRQTVRAGSGQASNRNLAVETFEKGFQALQRRQYAQAREMLFKLVTSYPEEKELHERARVYLAICERQDASSAEPRTFEERLCAATMAINGGSYDSGVKLLEALERDHSDHDHVQYLLAIAHTARGNTPGALAHLRRAIELRPANRLQATQDADLDPLRQDPAFLALLETPPETQLPRKSGRR